MNSPLGAHYLLLITYYLLLITHYSLLITYYINSGCIGMINDLAFWLENIDVGGRKHSLVST
ncbi:MAG: hypothetical protein F6K47_14885 [Symploca sp. SIO2E6]|nr:hypothetical protein [Symploca sp. SIO2E6]